MPSRDPHRRWRDILDNIVRIRQHVRGLTEAAFRRDIKTQDAVERCLERICEAARTLGDRYDKTYPDVGFSNLRQLGSVLRHDYEDVSADLIWIAIMERLPRLEAACRAELAATSPIISVPGAHLYGSAASRRPSPRKLKASTAMITGITGVSSQG
jgi:uncharacterized protein with HEPN domain